MTLQAVFTRASSRDPRRAPRRPNDELHDRYRELRAFDELPRRTGTRCRLVAATHVAFERVA